MTELADLATEVAACKRCPLAQGRTRAVPGEGPDNAAIMFVGEGPGFHEDQQGRPFVGAADQFLDELLQSIGLKRDGVYITNVVKCRPPGNLDPQPGEIAACQSYLDRQIALILPEVIVTLGRFSMQRYFPGQLFFNPNCKGVKAKLKIRFKINGIIMTKGISFFQTIKNAFPKEMAIKI